MMVYNIYRCKIYDNHSTKDKSDEWQISQWNKTEIAETNQHRYMVIWFSIKPRKQYSGRKEPSNGSTIMRYPYVKKWTQPQLKKYTKINLTWLIELNRS